jgi:hypothetical protein
MRDIWESLLERVMGFEPTTSCLGSKRSTTELHPHLLFTREFYDIKYGKSS